MKRGVFAACVVLTAALAAAFLLADRRDQGLVIVGWSALGLLCTLYVTVVGARNAVPMERRPRRLVVLPEGFRAPGHPDLSYLRGPIVVALGGFLSLAIGLRVWALIPCGVACLLALALTFRPFSFTSPPQASSFARLSRDARSPGANRSRSLATSR